MIWQKDDYLEEAYKQLLDNNFYFKINKDPTKHIQSIILTTIREANVLGDINDKIAEFLLTEFPRVPLFYLLPKIHKGISLTTGRPIVSGRSGLLEPLSQYIDSFLQPIIEEMPFIIKDTKYLVTLIEDMVVNQNTTLITMDVNSLYTTIPHDEARLVVQNALKNKYSESPCYFLMALLDIILDKSYFRFREDYFLSDKGCGNG